MSKEKTAQLRKFVAPFEKADVKASVRQLVNTIPPAILFWFLAYQALVILQEASGQVSLHLL